MLPGKIARGVCPSGHSLTLPATALCRPRNERYPQCVAYGRSVQYGLQAAGRYLLAGRDDVLLESDLEGESQAVFKSGRS